MCVSQSKLQFAIKKMSAQKIMSRYKRRTYLGHPSESPLQIFSEVGSYIIIMGTFPHSPERKKISKYQREVDMALLYQGCCVAPVWQGARAWLPRTVHYQPTERQDATDAGRGGAPRPGRAQLRGLTAATPTPTEVQRSPCVTRGHALVTHWSRGHVSHTGRCFPANALAAPLHSLHRRGKYQGRVQQLYMRQAVSQ